MNIDCSFGMPRKAVWRFHVGTSGIDIRNVGCLLLTERLALIASDDRCRTPESAFMVNGSLLFTVPKRPLFYDMARMSIPQSLKWVVFLVCNGDFCIRRCSEESVLHEMGAISKEVAPWKVLHQFCGAVPGTFTMRQCEGWHQSGTYTGTYNTEIGARHPITPILAPLRFFSYAMTIEIIMAINRDTNWTDQKAY